MSKIQAKFYHAGCPVCISVEQSIARVIDTKLVDLEIVHLGESRNRIPEAKAAGVKSVPALVLEGAPLHINFGAALSDLN